MHGYFDKPLSASTEYTPLTQLPGTDSYIVELRVWATSVTMIVMIERKEVLLALWQRLLGTIVMRVLKIFPRKSHLLKLNTPDHN